MARPLAAGGPEPMPVFDAVHARLVAARPGRSRTSLVHNDFKFDNCMFAPGDPDRATSIFDWDMATLGDPLIDLGTVLSYWKDRTTRSSGPRPSIST
ncbi:MAG: phosphotransferase [Acidimicrobiales bacterium]